MINKNSLFYATFTLLDNCLPRSLAIIPYRYCYHQLMQSAQVLPGECEVWVRNSVKQGNYVFGLSDLDLSLCSYASSRQDFVPVLRMLRDQKILFPFLGETNFYHPAWMMELKASANYYEIRRDPILFEKIRPIQNDIDGIVFLLRMLFADRTNLIGRPQIRSRKWLKHFEDLQLAPPLKINFDNICVSIAELAERPEVFEALQMLRGELKEPEMFFMPKKKFWKYLYPHKYLWFETDEVDDPAEILGSKLADICLRQIDWEVWGLMTQLPYIDDLNLGFKIHLERLGKVADSIGDKNGINQRIHLLLSHASEF
jgi:hypothetical protein